MIYLDWAATAIPDSGIIQKAADAWKEAFANPSSDHAPGRRAGEVLSESRNTWAECLGCRPENVVFTSGGTEGNNLVLQQLLFSKKAPHAVITGIEHASVFEPLILYKEFGVSLSLVSPEADGTVSPDKVAASLTGDTKLVSLIAVHNETGTVQPLEEIITAVRKREKSLKRRIHVHIDAVQAFGKLPFDPLRLDADSAVFSSHKIGGPRGAGILYVKKAAPTVTAGGEQEYGIRPGTENLFAIYGSALAAEKAVQRLEDNYRHAGTLMRLLFQKIGETASGNVSFFYSKLSPAYSPYINTLFIPPLPGEAAVRALSEEGFALGTGSACSRSKEKRMRGLKAIGIEQKLCNSAVRISTGCTTTEEDIESFCATLQRKILPLADAVKKT